MVTLAQLLDHLNLHISNLQKSERWAMYRLISPVVDFANQPLGWRDYYEFNQTSLHGTSQSVDVALLDQHGVPRVMIEAKRVGRAVSAELIDKYLKPGVRGVVSDGMLWVLCLDGRSSTLAMFDEHMRVITSATNRIVAFIQGTSDLGLDWGTTEKHYHRGSIRPARLPKAVLATRTVHEVAEARNAREFESAIVNLDIASSLDRIFLQTVADAFKVTWQSSCHLLVELRLKRVSFFDARVTGRSSRVARLELGKQQPDVLIRTTLVEPVAALLQQIPITPHDKGPHMRRFRIANDGHARLLASKLAEILMC